MGYTSGYGQQDINLGGGGDGVSGVTRIRGSEEVEFQTITDALATAITGDVVLVGPGDYEESFSIPAGVIVENLVRGTARIIGNSPTGPRVTLGAGASFRGFVVFTPTDADSAIRMPNDDAQLTDITFIGQGPASKCITASADRLIITGLNIFFAGVCARCIEITSGRLIVSEFNVGSANVTDAVIAVDNGEVEIGPLRIVGQAAVVQDGIQMNGGEIFSDSAEFLSGTIANGLHITADGTRIVLKSPFFDFEDVGLHLLVDPGVSLGSLFVVAGSGSQEKISAPQSFLNQATLAISFQDDNPGDESFVFLTELSVGNPFLGRETNLGEGDSTTAGMVVLRSPATAGPFTDITANLIEPDGSTVSLLPSTAVGSTLYIGGPFRHVGLKTLTDVAMDLGAGSVVFELSDGGGGWNPVLIMVSDAVAPYQQFSENIFGQAAAEQVRFGEGLSTFGSQVVDGRDLFWWRMRVTAPINTVPVGEQIKLSPNRVEANADGFVERYGAARKQFEIPILIEDLAGASPGNVTINFANNISITPVDNQFVNGATDGIGAIAPVPPGLDTSISLIFRFSFLPSSNVAGDVFFRFNYATRSLNDLLSVAIPSDQIDTIFSIPGGSQDRLQELIVPLEIPQAVPGDRIGIALRRLGADAADTYTGNVERVDIQLIGTFWN